MINKEKIFDSIDLFDFVDVMFVVLDNKGKVFAANKKACEVLGYKENEIIGKDWFSNFLPKYQQKEVKNVYLSLMQGKIKKTTYYENKIVTNDKKEKIILWHNIFLKDNKGKIIGTFSSGQDITKQKENENSLLEKITQLQTINRYTELRTKIWQLAADRNLTFDDIIDKAIALIGPVLKVSRVNYNIMDKKNFICIKEWRDKNVKNTLGEKIDTKIAKLFLKPQGFEITLEKALEMIPAGLKFIAKPIIKKFAEVNDLNAIFIIPIYYEDSIYGILSYDICNSNKYKKKFDDFDKSILIELRNILQSRIEYDRIHEAIIESEKKFKILFENAPDAYYINDLKGNFIDGNKKAEELTGYKIEELIGKNFLKLNLLPKSEIIKVTKLLAQNILEKDTGPDEIKLQRKDGTYVDAEILTRPIKLNNKKVVLGIARDITERKKITEEIRKLSIAVEQSPASIVITDIKGNIIYTNPKFTEITGYKEEEAKGKNPRILKSGNTTKEEYQRLWKTILSGKIWRGEFLNKKKNGELYWESATISPIFDEKGKIINFIAIKQDITEIKKARDKIIETGTLLIDFFDNANDLIQIVSPEAKFLYVNKAWHQTLVYNFDELKHMTLFDVIHPSKIEHCREMFKKVLKGECNERIETVFVTKDKREIIVEGAVSSHFEMGKPVNIRGIFRDITAKKKEEENLRMSYERLKEIDVLKTNFVSMVSHDLRTPMTAIKGFLSLLLGGAAGELTAQQKEYIEIAKNNSERLLNLINDLLDISKIESGRFTIEKSTCDIGRIISRLTKELSSFAAQKKINIINESEGKKLFCEVDEYRISQVITNLITNSVKFSPENTDVLLGFKSVKKGEVPVPENIKLKDSNEYVFIYEKDSGRGIKKEYIDKIFEKFYQVERSDGLKSKGLGLGLPIAKSIIEAHDGVIWAESEGEGKGTTFKILIPIRKK